MRDHAKDRETLSDLNRNYVRSVDDAHILAMIEEGNRVSGKMRFHGFHRKELFDVPPSGRHVWWTGMPIFTFEGAKVRDLFVLGDIHGLIGRLKGEAQNPIC